MLPPGKVIDCVADQLGVSYEWLAIRPRRSACGTVARMASPRPTYLTLIGKRQPGPGRAYKLAADRLAPAAFADPNGLRVGVNGREMSAEFCITDETPDRVGDVVIAKGISLANFRNVPIGFFNHQQFPLPIGKWEDPSGNCTIQIEDRRATGTLYFSQKSKEAAQVFDLVEENILRATSIGFNPLEEPIPRRHGDHNPNSIESGLIFPRIDLLEVSIVGVPANPAASRLRGWIERNHPGPMLKAALLPWCDPKKAWCPGFGPGQKEDSTMATKAKAKGKKKKDMAESSGPDGGYVAEAAPAPAEGRGHVVDMVRAVMEHHAADAHPDGPHDAYVSADGKSVHHVHNKDADPDHLATVKDDLGQIEGVGDVSQGDAPPAEDSGMAKEFPGEEGAEADGSTRPAEVDPEEEPPGETGEEKHACTCGAKSRKRAKAMTPDAGGEDDATTVTKDDPAASAAAPVVESAPMPHGAEMAQHIVEYLEECLAKAEPELHEFIESILEQTRDWGGERYPDTPLGGEEEDADGEAEPEGSAGDTPEAQTADREDAREALDQYRRSPVRWKKRYMNRGKLKCVKDAAEHLGDMAEMEHGTEITRTHKAACAFHAKALHGLLKEATGDMGDMAADEGDGGEAPVKAAKTNGWSDADLATLSGELSAVNGKLDAVRTQFRRTTGRDL